jgi:hypothetical protein
MRKHLLAVACLASLGLANSASATTILQFTQTNPNDVITGTAAAGVTTLTTNSAAAPGSIPVLIVNVGGAPLPIPILAFETFTGVHSVGAASLVGGTITQMFTGTIAITSLAGGAGTNFLTATFTDTVAGAAGGSSGSMFAAQPPDSVAFTSSFPVVQAFINASVERDMSLGFTGISPSLSITGGTIASFTTQNVGTFAAVIPEPASVVSASMAVLAGLGCLGLRRKSSKV